MRDDHLLAVQMASSVLRLLHKTSVVAAEEAGVTQTALLFSLWALLGDHLLKGGIPCEDLTGVILETERVQNGQEHLS